MTDKTSDHSWFANLGLGIFIHWGHPSNRGWELSWQMVGGVEGQYPPRIPVPCEEYFANAATFNPTSFDADEWAKAIAGTGASYAVFTTKHHDGFALWDTDLSDYSITRSAPFGRDIVGELVPALRDAGLRVGLYFSIVDWHSPLYPRFTDESVCKPYQIGHYPRQPETWVAYREFLLGQLTELLTNYGPIDIIWLDGEFEHSPSEWDFESIRDHIRGLQPGCIVNDRCKGYGDFHTPEQQLPEIPPAGPWEQCVTMNNSWSYVPTDTAWKSTNELVATLVETVSAGGNLLLNIGPDGTGTIPVEVTRRLEEIGAWVHANGDAIRDLKPGLRPWQCRLPSARRMCDGGERLYLYLTMDPGTTIRVRDLPVRRITAVTSLASGEPLDFVTSANLADVQRKAADPMGDLVITWSGLKTTIVPVVAVDITT